MHVNIATMPVHMPFVMVVDGHSTLTGGFFCCVIRICIMIKTHASVSKTTDGRTAVWRFCEIGDGVYAAIGDNRKIIPCRDMDHMRSVYKRFTSTRYGLMCT